MKNKRHGEALEVLMIIVIVAILGFSIFGQYYFCPARWEDSGLKARFAFGKGCQVQRKDGSWVPEKSLRDVSL